MRCLMSSGSLLPHFSLSHQSTVFFEFFLMLGQSDIDLTAVSLFSPIACPSSLLLWGAHDQKLSRHSPRRAAQRAPRGRSHRRSVPGCHVHASPTGDSHSRQQPTAGSAHPQRLKLPLSVPANTNCSIFFLRKIQKSTQKLISVCERSWKSQTQLCLYSSNDNLRIYFQALHDVKFFNWGVSVPQTFYFDDRDCAFPAKYGCNLLKRLG